MRETIGVAFRALLFPLCLAALATNSWAAESTDQSAQAVVKPPPGQLDNGLISLTKLAPTITRVSDYSGGIWERNTMFGDLGGRRSDWYDKGFSLDMQVTQVYQKVTSGGSATGNGNAAYNGLSEINAYLDTAKLGWWSGGLLATTVQTSWGNPLESEAGNISLVNVTPLWPVPYHNTTRVMEYYLTQGLPHEMILIAGRLDATNFLDTNSYANTPESQFLNGSFNNDLLWGELLTFSTYAGLLIIPVSEGFDIATGIWTPDTQPDDYAGDWNDIAAVINPIFSYHIGDKPGKLKFAYAYSTEDTVAFDNPFYGPIDPRGKELVSSKSDNWLFTINIEQHLWTPQGRKENYASGTQDFDNNPPGIGLFYRFGYMPDDRNAFNMTMSGGIGGRGVIPGRPNDRMGIGVYGFFASDHFQEKSLLLNELLDDEVGFEAYYNFAITPWMQISADVQYIDQGLTTSDDAWVVGSRLNVRF